MRPGGKLLFVEHGLAPDQGVRRWQDRLTPAWRCISGGCHLNRPIRSMIEAAGFRIDRIETGYMPGPKPMTPQQVKPFFRPANQKANLRERRGVARRDEKFAGAGPGWMRNFWPYRG
jgi:hypothetical protein